MKKILLITLLLIPVLGFSQTTKPIDGFLGIKFGSSKLVVITAIKAKGGIIDKANSNADMIAFTNVKLGHRTSSGFAVRFINNKAFFAMFLFKADNDPATIDYYNELVNDISDVYGQGNPTKDFKSGFKDGDGNEIAAIQNGYADYHTDYFDTNNNLIQIAINTDLFVTLSYTEEALRKQADAAQKAKDKSDY